MHAEPIALQRCSSQLVDNEAVEQICTIFENYDRGGQRHIGNFSTIHQSTIKLEQRKHTRKQIK